MKTDPMDKLVSDVPQVARTMQVRLWLRPVAFRGMLSVRKIPLIGEGYRSALNALSEEERFRLESALRTTGEHYAAASDMYGVAGIPIFLGVVALAGFGNISLLALGVYLAVLVFYFSLYAYYRSMQGLTEALVSIGALSDELRWHASEREEDAARTGAGT